MLLLDEPASALDPIATASIEELMHTLKNRYTIVIVTHNMQQAARVADRTAFFSLDRIGSRGDADRVRGHRDDLPQPAGHPHAGLRHRPVRLIAGQPGEAAVARSSGAAIASLWTCWSSGWPHCQQ